MMKKCSQRLPGFVRLRPILIGSLIAGAVTILGLQGTASAALSPALDPGRVPQTVIDATTTECAAKPAGAGYSASQTEWVSPLGSPQTSLIDVNYGTPFVDLQLNYLTYRCKVNPGTNTLFGHFHIDSVSATFNSAPYPGAAGAISALSNYDSRIPYNDPFVVGPYPLPPPGVLATLSPTPGAFRILGPFTTSGRVDINTVTRGTITNRSSTGAISYNCALQNTSPPDNPPPITAENQWGVCTPGGSTFSVQINVGPQPTALQPIITSGSGLTDGGSIQAGGTYQFYTTAANNTTVTSRGFVLNFGNSLPARVVNGTGSQAVGPLAGSATVRAPSGGYIVTIDPTTPNGTPLCFTASIIPTAPDTTLPPDQMCFTVQRAYSPGVVGMAGDVHAGGGLCDSSGNLVPDITNGPGNITGNPNGNNFYSEYVTSASALIANFGSNGSKANTNAALGGNGSYLTVCRPDLVRRAQTPSEQTSAAFTTSFLPGSGSVAFDVSGKQGLYIARPGITNVNVTGTVSKAVTLAVLGGTVTFTGNVQPVAASLAGDQSPAFGVIASGDVVFDPAVTSVAAYVFSNGTVNTCVPNKSPECTGANGTLSVNGFLFAHKFLLNRFGPTTGTVSSTTGEQIRMTPQLFLNTPPLFNTFEATGNGIKSLGERPPLN